MNFYLVTKDSLKNRMMPVLWCSAKTYYEEHGKRVNEWTWSDPWLANDRTVDEILEVCADAPPDILGCSVYVWNVDFMEELAQRVKQQYPNCLVVFGGPQVDIKYSDDYFVNNPWVDVVCPSDGYGEIIITALLDQHPVENFNNIPYVYYTNQQREKLFSTTEIEKRSFVWPNNIFKAQESTLEQHPIDVAIYETTRGCPYKCIYCDWGGGTYSKISKKPFTTVLDEWEWMASHKIKNISIADANFGIMEIDLAITDHIVDMKRKYGYPEGVTTESAKNHLDRTVKIYEKFLENKLAYFYKIAVQAVDENIKNNIERIDIPFDEQIKSLNYLRNKYKDISVKIETIIGMPGDSYQLTLDQIDRHADNNIPVCKSEVWALLPEAPAYSPEMREKFQLKTVKKLFLSTPLILKNNALPDPGVNYFQETNSNRVEYVVGTYSYSVDDFVDMFIVNALASAGTATGLDQLWSYFSREHNIKASVLVDFIYKRFVLNYENFKTKDLAANFGNAVTTLKRFVHEPNFQQSAIDYHPDFPLLMPPHTYIPFVIGLNAQEFYQEICTAIADQFGDDRVIDLGHYISHRLMDVTYNFDHGRVFKTKYNWHDYFVNASKLTAGDYTYQTSDTTLIINPHKNTSELPNWHTYPKDSLQQKKQYYYQSVTRMYVSRLSERINLL